MFSYKIQEINQDIEAYLKNGAFSFCTLPSYYQEAKRYIAKEAQTLNQLCNNNGFSVLSFALFLTFAYISNA